MIEDYIFIYICLLVYSQAFIFKTVPPQEGIIINISKFLYKTNFKPNFVPNFNLKKTFSQWFCQTKKIRVKNILNHYNHYYFTDTKQIIILIFKKKNLSLSTYLRLRRSCCHWAVVVMVMVNGYGYGCCCDCCICKKKRNVSKLHDYLCMV